MTFVWSLGKTVMNSAWDSHRCHNLPSFGLNFFWRFLHFAQSYDLWQTGKNWKWSENNILFFCGERKIGEIRVHINYVLSSLTLITYNLQHTYIVFFFFFAFHHVVILIFRFTTLVVGDIYLWNPFKTFEFFELLFSHHYVFRRQS